MSVKEEQTYACKSGTRAEGELANLLPSSFQISVVVTSGNKKERTDKCVQIISQPKYGSEQERKGANLLPNGFQILIVVTSGNKKERTDKCVQIISKPKYGSEQERK